MTRSQVPSSATRKTVPLFVVLCHSVLAIAVAWLVASAESPEAAMVWNLFMLVDFPSGLLGGLLLGLGPADRSIAGLSVAFIWLPAVVFALLGGMQYYFVTLLVLKTWRKHRAVKPPTKGASARPPRTRSG